MSAQTDTNEGRMHILKKIININSLLLQNYKQHLCGVA